MSNSYLQTGEIAGSTSRKTCPDIDCTFVKFKAVASNAGKVYIGPASVTKVAGTDNDDAGFELSAGEDTGWIPATNVNLFSVITDNAGDDTVYIAIQP
jgi:hypothetical protein